MIVSLVSWTSLLSERFSEDIRCGRLSNNHVSPISERVLSIEQLVRTNSLMEVDWKNGFGDLMSTVERK